MKMQSSLSSEKTGQKKIFSFFQEVDPATAGGDST